MAKFQMQQHVTRAYSITYAKIRIVHDKSQRVNVPLITLKNMRYYMQFHTVEILYKLPGKRSEIQLPQFWIRSCIEWTFCA
jgi:hypothetical protein